MSSYAEVVVLVEGPTEQRFVKQLLGPYMANRGVYLTPIILDKPSNIRLGTCRGVKKFPVILREFPY